MAPSASSMNRPFPDVTRPAVAKPASRIDAALADVGFAPAHGRHVGGIDPERATDRRRTPAARPSLGAAAWLDLRCSASGARHAAGAVRDVWRRRIYAKVDV